MNKRITCLIISVLTLFCLFSRTIFAVDKADPIAVNKPVTGVLAEDVVFMQDTVFAMPAEIILDNNKDCHIFGFIILSQGDPAARTATGLVKRLACKNTKDKKGFTIWNVDGNFLPTSAASIAPKQATPAVSIPMVSSVVAGKTIYTVKAGINLTVNPTDIGDGRPGLQIYLYQNNLTEKPFKIQLGELPSFGGKKLEELPELAQ